jgi:hypothetical protein
LNYFELINVIPRKGGTSILYFEALNDRAMTL